MSKIHSRFFLISFFPAIAYWYLEANYPIKIALIGGLGLAILEISLEWIFTRHVHKISKLNFFLIAGLGGLSLLGDDGLWFKLQPFFTGLFFGGFLIFKTLRGKGFLWGTMEDMGQKPPFSYEHWAPLEKRFGLFLLTYGIFMGGLALFATTGLWASFKTLGFYVVFFIYMGIEFYFLRHKLIDDSKQ